MAAPTPCTVDDDNLYSNLNLMLLAFHIPMFCALMLCALSLIRRIWMDLMTRRREACPAFHITVLCTLSLIRWIWIDLVTRRRGASPTSPRGNLLGDAGYLPRVDRHDAAPADGYGSLLSPLARRAGGGPSAGFMPAPWAAFFSHRGRIRPRMQDVHPLVPLEISSFGGLRAGLLSPPDRQCRAATHSCD